VLSNYDGIINNYTRLIIINYYFDKMSTLPSVYPPVCVNATYQGWMDMFYCISPYAWAWMGLAMALGFSIVGAAW